MDIPSRQRVTSRTPGVVNRLQTQSIPGQGAADSTAAIGNSFVAQAGSPGYDLPYLIGYSPNVIPDDTPYLKGYRGVTSTGGFTPNISRPGIGSEVAKNSSRRFGGRQNDSVTKDYNLSPFKYVGNFLGGAPDREWTRQGNIRPSLIMGRTRLRTNYAGIGSGQANEGMHTYLPVDVAQPTKGKEKMQSRSQGRLTVNRYRGQSFSSQTEILGNT